MSDAPIEPKYRAQMTAIAEALDHVFNGELKHPHKKTGFVLLVFPYGNCDGRANYLSNGASRADIVSLFRELAAKFEGSPDQEGHG